MIEEQFQVNGYEVTIFYDNHVDNSLPKSKQYRLQIMKDGKIYKNRSGLTLSGAKTELERWLLKRQ